MASTSKPRGFTLLEMLVAIAIFAAIAIAAHAGLQAVLQTRVEVEAGAARLARLQLALALMQRDLEQAIDRGIRDEYAAERPPLAGGGAGGEPLELTRAGWENPLRRHRSTLQRLAYRVEEGALVRLHWNRLDRAGASEPVRSTLLEAVEALRLRFLDQDDAWQRRWPLPSAGAAPPGLPRAVEVTLVTRDEGEIVRLFRMPDPAAGTDGPP